MKDHIVEAMDGMGAFLAEHAGLSVLLFWFMKTLDSVDDLSQLAKLSAAIGTSIVVWLTVYGKIVELFCNKPKGNEKSSESGKDGGQEGGR